MSWRSNRPLATGKHRPASTTYWIAGAYAGYPRGAAQKSARSVPSVHFGCGAIMGQVLRNACAFIAAVLLLTTSLAQTPHQHHAQHMSAEEYARVLNDPERDKWQKPHEVIQALALKPDAAIADIGAGTGYFTLRFARHVKKVYAVDIDPGLLEMTKKNAPANVETVLASPDDPKLPERSVDTVFFCDVLHHIDNRTAYLGKLKRALKPGGRVVDVDFYKKPLPVGPPESMKLSEKEVEKEFKDAGFRLAKTDTFLPYQYFLTFRAD